MPNHTIHPGAEESSVDRGKLQYRLTKKSRVCLEAVKVHQQISELCLSLYLLIMSTVHALY